VEDGEIEFSKSKWLLFKDYRPYFFVLLITTVTDAISTTYFMSLLGPEQESNFVVRDLAFYYGIYVGPFLGKIYQIFAVWGLSVIAPRLTKWICLVVISLNLMATIINIAVYLEAFREAVNN
tara:strand:+ start:862 stop:1227 length:366 start_codon:yes stop_codon:yes gene_type:complete